jgi:hypothetical protein
MPLTNSKMRIDNDCYYMSDNFIYKQVNKHLIIAGQPMFENNVHNQMQCH